MISITCTNCRTLLEMDEAFAGGVCRCQFCGTIQTVPSHLKATAGAAKSFYSTPAGSAGAQPSSGLDDLASAVSNSGLSGSGLRSKVPQSGQSRSAGLDYQNARTAPANKSWIVILLGVLILGLVGAVGFLWFARSVPPTPVSPNGPGVTGTPAGTGTASQSTPSTPTPAVTSGPNFVGLGLGGGNKVVYVIDRGNSGERFFDPLKYAVSRSIESLGAGHQFAVVFWRRTSDADVPMTDMSFPAAGLANASSDQAGAFLQKFQDMTASGSTGIDEAIAEAVKRGPSTVVIVTAKDNLNLEGVAESVEKARGSANIKIYTVTVGGAGSSSVLDGIARKYGGKYAQVEEQALRDQ